MSTAKLSIPKIRLRFFNNCLTIVVAVLAIYITAAPFLPQFSWWLRHDSPVRAVIAKKQSPAAKPPAQQIMTGDELFIPSMDLDKPIYGGGKGNLHKGVWHVPNTSTPDKGGNTVLVGHRFTYKDPYGGVFYHLDKVAVGDPITMHWQGKVYSYRVSEVEVVPATELSVEANTAQPQLTIYTCTPLWTVTHRLVIIAKPLEGNS